MRETGYFELARFGRLVLREKDWEPEAGKTMEELSERIEQGWQDRERFGRLFETAEAFGLWPEERYAVFLALLPELDGRFGAIFELFGGTGGRPTAQLAADMWRANHGEEAHIRMERLNRFFLQEGNAGLCLRPYAAGFLAGYDWQEADTGNIPVKEEGSFVYQTAQRLLAGKNRRLFSFCGPAGSGRKSCLRLMAERDGRELFFIRKAGQLERGLFFAAAGGFAVGIDADSLLLEAEGEMEGDGNYAVSWTGRAAGEAVGRLFAAADYFPFLRLAAVICREEELSLKISSALSGQERQLEAVSFGFPKIEERYRLWEQKCRRFGAEPGSIPGLRRIANQYVMTPGEMEESLRFAVREARRSETARPKAQFGEKELTAGIRAVLKGNFQGKAVRVEAGYGFEDLVLPERQKRRLMEACAQMRLRHQVLSQWGLGGRMSYGTGISMVFSGPPGTGKTMAAQAVAKELRMDLYRVDLASVVSKYIGETEKNLKQIFDEARKSQVVLFFDEADVLFSRRTEVKGAGDRYANLEAAFLIQEMESYEGAVILATNFLKNMDEAFRRRMKFIVEFPFPDERERRLIWERAIPARMPVKELDFDFLAERFELSGSNIRNVVYHGAFLAAEAGRPLAMEDLIRAVENEYEKTGKAFSWEEAGPYRAV